MITTRIRIRATATALSLLASITAGASSQEVGPPVVEYRNRGLGSFEVRNNGLFPMTVVIEPFGFVQDSVGRITYVPFDTTRIRLRLSAMSLRLPARSSLSVSYEAVTDSAPAWFVITSTFHGLRRQGINYNFQLPHVVYLHQKAAVRSAELQITELSVDATARQARFKIRNPSTGLTRCSEGTLTSGSGARAPISAFPLFPHFERWVSAEWTHSDVPTTVRLACSGGELTYDRRTPAAGGGP
jgi:hypothetical protein